MNDHKQSDVEIRSGSGKILFSTADPRKMSESTGFGVTTEGEVEQRGRVITDDDAAMARPLSCRSSRWTRVAAGAHSPPPSMRAPGR